MKSPEVLCSFIIYIKEQWDTDPKICDLEELRACALLKTNNGFVNPVTQPVHFTVEYGNETNLKKDFPSKFFQSSFLTLTITKIYSLQWPLIVF